jgi:flagellar motor switch protein FliM
MSFASTPPASLRRQRVRELDFRRPSKFSRDQIRHLERAHEAFTRSVSSRLSAELREEVSLSLLGSDQLPYSVAMVEESPREALVAVLDVAPLRTQIALICEMELAHAFVNRLLGGEQPRTGAPETLTELELAVAETALTSVVEALSTTWTEMAGVRLSLAGLETSPMAVELVPPSEPTLMVSLSVTIGSLVSRATLMLPHPAVAPILPSLERGAFPSDEAAGLAPGTMNRAVGGVGVTVRAEVGGVDLPVGAVLALKRGDVVRLGRNAAAGAQLFVDDVAVATVAPGRSRSLRAVQVTGRGEAAR